MGVITWENPNIDKGTKLVKKQKQLLSDALKDYFGINDDPFFPYKTAKEYKLKIRLIPDSD